MSTEKDVYTPITPWRPSIQFLIVELVDALTPFADLLENPEALISPEKWENVALGDPDLIELVISIRTVIAAREVLAKVRALSFYPGEKARAVYGHDPDDLIIDECHEVKPC